MESIFTFLISVAASIVAYYICKWLDGNRQQCLISLRQERTPMRCARSHRGSFFWHHMGIFTFAYPYLSTIHSLRQRRFPPAPKTKQSPRACGSMKWMKKPARIRAKPNVKQKKSQELAVLDKPKLTCALNKKNPQKISHIFWGFVLLCLWHHYLCLSVSQHDFPHASTLFAAIPIPCIILRGGKRNTSHQSLVLRFLNNWHLSQLPNQVRSEE